MPPGQSRCLSTSHGLISFLRLIAFTSSPRFRCSSPRLRHSFRLCSSRRRPKCSSATRSVEKRTSAFLRCSRNSLLGLWYAILPLRAWLFFSLLNMKSNKISIKQFDLTPLCRLTMTPRVKRTTARRSHCFACSAAHSRGVAVSVVLLESGRLVLREYTLHVFVGGVIPCYRY